MPHEYFVDRSLGRHDVINALRECGGVWSCTTITSARPRVMRNGSPRQADEGGT